MIKRNKIILQEYMYKKNVCDKIVNFVNLYNG